MSKVPINIDGEFKVLEITEALVEFLNVKRKWLTSKEISEQMGIPYTTIHHRLVRLADENKIKSKKDRSMKTGRKATKWGSLELE